MSNCTVCNAEGAYLGLNDCECTNPGCRCYRAPEAPQLRLHRSAEPLNSEGAPQIVSMTHDHLTVDVPESWEMFFKRQPRMLAITQEYELRQREFLSALRLDTCDLPDAGALPATGEFDLRLFYKSLMFCARYGMGAERFAKMTVLKSREKKTPG